MGFIVISLGDLSFIEGNYEKALETTEIVKGRMMYDSHPYCQVGRILTIFKKYEEAH